MENIILTYLLEGLFVIGAGLATLAWKSLHNDIKRTQEMLLQAIQDRKDAIQENKEALEKLEEDTETKQNAIIRSLRKLISAIKLVLSKKQADKIDESAIINGQ